MRHEGNLKLKATALQLFKGLARSYDLTVDIATLFQDRYWKNWVAEWTSAEEGKMVLDLGCGTLLMEERLQRRGYKFVGLDLTEKMIRIGQTKDIPGVRLLVNGDAENLPFPDGSFSSIISCYVVKYVDLKKFAEEISRVTKPGATVVLYDFVRPRGPLAPFLELYVRGGMRTAGALLGLTRNDSSFTFSNLPSIVDASVWDARIEQVMQSKGFRTRALRRLSGGIVCAYCGVKRA
ncbi:MAG TPA: class I SAM-dependent methyltransferase [Nitrososphaerales archaeon]|nr:class I SAM-dependent methyltransferase [Nitrososphaerales archaeon]